MKNVRDDLRTRHVLRELADSALTRAAGARLVAGNSVRLLKDARQNYPAWLEAIRGAKHHAHLETYFICEDDSGREFADAMIAKAREGVRVRLIYDWLGSFRKTSRRFWNYLRAAGVEVRCYNPPQFDSPFGWLSRDHRKLIAVDGCVGFISGLCIGKMWTGEPELGLEPWRDTGVEVRGPAVADIEQAFAEIWGMIGEPIPEIEIGKATIECAGNMDVRIIASLPATAGMIRTDALVAALARTRLWLTDAYFAGTTAYVQALRAAAQDGVDVRLLVPNATDIPMLRPLTRAGYRTLLEAGVRIFEWNGAMIHAKCAVADEHWARVGSTNLNIASWFGNCEMDVVVENDSFARGMQEMYLQDLSSATEIILNPKRKVLAAGVPRRPLSALPRSGGSAGRAAAGAIRVGNAIGAAFTNHRVLEPVEARIMLTTGVWLLAIAVLLAAFPRVWIYSIAAFLLWLAGTLIYRGCKLRSESKQADHALIEQRNIGHNPPPVNHHTELRPGDGN